MLHAQNSYIQNAQSVYRPVAEVRHQQGTLGQQDDYKLLVVLEPVATLRKHFVDLAHKAFSWPVQVYETGQATDVTGITARKTPSLFVIDVSSTDRRGLTTAAEVWAKYPDARILFWCSSFKDSHYQQICLMAPPQGVYGIVLKSCPDERLIHAIQSLVVHENTFIDSEVRRTLHEEPASNNKLTRSEYETLCDVMLGLTDKAIAKRRNLSARGVQNRLAALFAKVLRGKHSWLRESASMDVYNLRTRLIFEVLRRGLIDSESLALLDDELDSWISEQFGV
jgi:DNA-binding NarL/FixJ family response regulator